MADEESGTEGGALVSPEFADNEMLAAVAASEATLSRGVKSGAVLAIQKALVALDAAVRADGDFGPRTEAAILSEQYRAQLPKTGVIDAATLRAIDLRLAQKRKDGLLAAMGEGVTTKPSPAETRSNTENPSRTDEGFFEDAAGLPNTNPEPVADPDSPSPDKSTTKGAPLSADRQGMVAALRRALGALDEDKSGIAALERLLAAGRLSAGPLLPNLVAMANMPRNPALMLEAGIEPALLLAQTVRHVENPLRSQQGFGRGTCGAGVLQYLLLRVDPAEFVRLLDGITREAGQVQSRGGRKLILPHSAIARDNSERVDIDRMFQSTLMNHASSMSWIFDYDNPNDDDTFWAAVRGNSQVTVWGFASLYQDLLGVSFASATIMSRSRSELCELAVSRALKGEKVPVIIKFNEYHWLSVEWVERGRDGKPVALVLRNPWGQDDAKGPPRRTALPEGGGRVRITYEDFEANVFGVVVRG